MDDQVWALTFVIVGAAVGVIGTVITTHQQNKYSHARWRRDQQKVAYMAFLREWHERFDALFDYVYDFSGGSGPSEDYLVPLYRMKLDLDVFGSRIARASADDAYEKLRTYWDSGKDARDAAHARAIDAIDDYAAQVRADMGSD